MGRVFKIACICLATFAVAGCIAPSRPSPEEAAVRDVISRYNQMIIQGYRAMNMNGMSQVATKLQSEDEYIFMSSLAEGGVRLDATLKDLTFLKVSVEATSATAETREVWDYKHFGRADGKLVQEEDGLVYHLAWDLEKQPTGVWLVSDVRAISTTSTGEPKQLETVTPVPPKKD